jgi:hypothetical protein
MIFPNNSVGRLCAWACHAAVAEICAHSERTCRGWFCEHGAGIALYVNRDTRLICFGVAQCESTFEAGNCAGLLQTWDLKLVNGFSQRTKLAVALLYEGPEGTLILGLEPVSDVRCKA